MKKRELKLKRKLELDCSTGQRTLTGSTDDHSATIQRRQVSSTVQWIFVILLLTTPYPFRVPLPSTSCQPAKPEVESAASYQELYPPLPKSKVHIHGWQGSTQFGL